MGSRGLRETLGRRLVAAQRGEVDVQARVLERDFTGRWAAVAVLVELAVVFLVLIFPVTRVLARWVQLSSSWVAPGSPLAEVPVMVECDLNEVVVFLDHIKGCKDISTILVHPELGLDPVSELQPLVEEAWEALRCLHDLERVRRSMWDLFGNSPLCAAADRVIELVAHYCTVRATQICEVGGRRLAA
ncbi:hypothetical protein [Streptomyces sp. NPDC059010]|uniref:hypothetical protein n=1 Tax=Streptomyces sp. NPDC059010 TaxID=3346695 RepID=UPI0036C26DE9